MKYKKISGALLAAFEDLENEGPVALTRHSRTLAMAPVLGTQKPPRAIVFIHCDESANLGPTSVPTGTRMNQKQGRVRTAIVELAKLGDLSDSPKVKRIVGSRRLRPLLDSRRRRFASVSERRCTRYRRSARRLRPGDR